MLGSWIHWIHHLRSSFIPSVLRDPSFLLRFPQLCMNLLTHTPTLRALCSLTRSRSSSRSSSFGLTFAMLRTSFTILASAFDAGNDLITGLLGHVHLSWSHSRPWCQSADEWIEPPLLARSAGFCSVDTYLHWISCCNCILATRFATNCLYWPFPLIKCKATVLSLHPYDHGVGMVVYGVSYIYQ